MTYKEKYFEIINNGLKDKPESGYYEHHHIVPKSLCQLLKNSKQNLVYLTAKNHFLAHYYIYHWFKDELHEKKWANKMCFALIMMKKQLMKSDNIEKLSELYEEVRKDLSEKMSFLSSHRTEETKRKLSEANKGKNNPFFGKHHTDETKRKIIEAKRKIIEAQKIPILQFTKDMIFIRE